MKEKPQEIENLASRTQHLTLTPIVILVWKEGRKVIMEL